MSNSESNALSRVNHPSYEYIWACELTTERPAVTWCCETEEDGDSDFLTHTLFLKQAVLGASAVKGERNLVSIETKNFDGDDIVAPLFSLTLGQNDCSFLDVSFGNRIPVTMKLTKGAGPVSIIGQQLTEPGNDEAQDELYTEDEEEEEVPLKLAKKRKAGAQKSAKAKKGKLEASFDESDTGESIGEEDEEDDEDEDEEEEDEEEEEEEEESPPKKSRAKSQKNAKDKAGDTKAKKGAAKSSNGKAAAKKGKKAK